MYAFKLYTVYFNLSSVCNTYICMYVEYTDMCPCANYAKASNELHQAMPMKKRVHLPTDLNIDPLHMRVS